MDAALPRRERALLRLSHLHLQLVLLVLVEVLVDEELGRGLGR